MNKPKPRINPFAKIATRVPPPVQSRPVSIHGCVVIIKIEEDGTVTEKTGRPSFLYCDPKSAVVKYRLPADTYLDGSAEHLARRAELGLK